MGDDGGGGDMTDMDGCECICDFSHQRTMQRLMNMLRGSQSFCTDEQCLQDLPGQDASPDGGMSTMMLIMLGWIVIATALYLFRPRAMRSRGDGKPSNNGPDNHPPPTPPVH